MYGIGEDVLSIGDQSITVKPAKYQELVPKLYGKVYFVCVYLCICVCVHVYVSVCICICMYMCVLIENIELARCWHAGLYILQYNSHLNNNVIGMNS